MGRQNFAYESYGEKNDSLILMLCKNFKFYFLYGSSVGNETRMFNVICSTHKTAHEIKAKILTTVVFNTLVCKSERKLKLPGYVALFGECRINYYAYNFCLQFVDDLWKF